MNPLLYIKCLSLVSAFNFSNILVVPLIIILIIILKNIITVDLNGFEFVKLDLFVFLVLAAYFLSLMLNIGNINQLSLNHFSAIATVIIIFYFFAEHLLRKYSEKDILRSLWIGYVFCCSLSLVEFAAANIFSQDLSTIIPRPSVDDYEPLFLDLLIRARGSFVESGHFASFISICIPLLFYYNWILSPSFVRKTIFIVLTVSSLFCSFSISAFMFIPLALILILVLRIRTKIKFFSKYFWYGFAAIAMLIIIEILYSISDVYFSKFTSASYEDRYVKFTQTISLMFNSSVLDFLFGYGPGSYKELGVEPSISVYVNTFRDAGFVGLLTWFILFAYSLTVLLLSKNAFANYILFSILIASMFFIAIPNYFLPHFMLPFLFIKKLEIATGR